jgi:hypothetical protein
VLDFNRANLSVAPISVAINDAIERAEPPEENSRQYLGASAIGSECLRKVQYDRAGIRQRHGLAHRLAGTDRETREVAVEHFL